jgi:nucleotide-binding universal stress UspA family protein
MKNTTTLLVIDPETPDGVITDLANSAFEDQTHLNCLMLGAAPTLPVYAYGAPPYSGMNIPDDWGQSLHATRKALTTRETQIEVLLAHSGVSAGIQSLLCASLDIKNIVAQHARVCDIAVIASDSADIKREAAHGVLFKSPIGLMLNASSAKRMAHVFIAWDSSEAAAVAAHAALPYLRAAREVTIACFDPIATPQYDGPDPGTDVAAWLSHHGCTVTVSQFPTGGREVAHCIQDRAKESGADLVVMGAYGHSRMFEVFFGGTTRSMMDQTDAPVLLAH